MKNILPKLRHLGALLFLGLTACQTRGSAPMQEFTSLPPGYNPVLAPYQTFKSPDYYGDLAVKFNNAYKELYTDNEEAGRRDPQNPDKLFVQLIQRAQTSLDLAIFDIEEPSAVEALIQARQRGVKIRIMTDSDNLLSKGELLPHFVAMQQAGIQFKGDDRSGLMHHKFMVIDKTLVITGSSNLTPYSLYRDNNNSLSINSPQLAANYQVEFERMFEEGLLGPNEHKMPYPTVKVDGASIRTYFSPKGGTKVAILETLSKATKGIQFMAFSVTDQDIQKLLVKKAREGVQIEGIFDGCMLSQYSIYQDLLTKNIPVKIDGNQALMHSKVFIVDREVVITGSYNFSMSAEERNNENTLIIRSPKIAGFYEAEFQRLNQASDQNRPPPYDNRACSSPLLDGDVNPV